MPTPIHTAALREEIDRRIHVVRGAKVMLGPDLALLYQVPPRVFVQAVKRKMERFPPDFMFQLSPREYRRVVTKGSMPGWGSVRKMPYAFTIQGIIMLSGVLQSRRGVRLSIEIIRSFVRFRRSHASNIELVRTLQSIEEQYDPCFRALFDAMNGTVNSPEFNNSPPLSLTIAPSSQTIQPSAL